MTEIETVEIVKKIVVALDAGDQPSSQDITDLRKCNHAILSYALRSLDRDDLMTIAKRVFDLKCPKGEQ